jgi:hypothetical protein
MSGAQSEGVVKFEADHEERPLDFRALGELGCTLIAWREILAQTGLIGRDPERYGGAGYGNVSARILPWNADRGERPFLVTGTQTSDRRDVSLDSFCVVRSWSIPRNRVVSFGPILPSSESMTHGAVYDLSPAIRFVFHAHCPVIWRRASLLRIPTTDPAVPYGTPEMAREVSRLWRTSSLLDLRIFVMGGHEDGVVVFGRTAEEAGEVMLRFLARGYAAQCGVRRD